MTSAKRRAAASVALPLPAATSSTRSPARMSAASASSSPTICSVVPITAKSPDAHIACCFGFRAAKSTGVAVTEFVVVVMISSPAPGRRQRERGITTSVSSACSGNCGGGLPVHRPPNNLQVVVAVAHRVVLEHELARERSVLVERYRGGCPELLIAE